MIEFKDNISIIGDVPELPKYALTNNDWRDGLIIRSPNWLGDAIMTLPAIIQLKKIIPPTCGLFVICPPGLKDLYESLPMFDVIIPLHQAHKMWKWREIKRIRFLYPGVGILFNNSLRDTIMMKMAKIPKLFGAKARSRQFLLAKGFSFPKRVDHGLNNQHHAAKYLAMAYALGAPAWDGSLPDFVVNKEPEIIDRLLIKISKKDHILALAAGAAYGEAKRWPVEYFKEISRWWINNGGSIIVLGGKAEKDIGAKIVGKLPVDRAYNLAGQTDLSELILLLQKAEMCVANDSGIMHLSAALNKPGLGIFGSTDPTATPPISSTYKLLYEKQDCSPCFKRQCPLETYACLKSITPDMVIEQLDQFH